MEILPTTNRPLVEARLKPTDIDVVREGQPERLRFSALNARSTPSFSRCRRIVWLMRRHSSGIIVLS
ncbi:hypothetical protein ELI43_37285 [Rhizobium leguminosarum]|uniref:hypothetical protein n=1 Tax=Rhizobium leguminosarum TaxID=384 RepID=UPI0010309A3C|nr:hypothetical protein ELI43_37285 [Rhizobium leguminosarum]